MRRIVAKFGGTSMGSADAMRKASAIVRSVDGEVIVVVSAVTGTTDALIALGNTAVEGGDWEVLAGRIKERHRMLVRELDLDLHQQLSVLLDEMWSICRVVAQFGELGPSVLDRLLSLGERLSATIFAEHLVVDGVNAEMVDAFDLIATDRQFGCANVDFPVTNSRTAGVLFPMITNSVIPVVTGFIGQSNAPHRYTTLGRGGSDYSAAIIAAAMDATELQIWTDVDGMFTADPRVIPGATVLTQLSYAEAGELAYFGAKVLHPKTIKPAIEREIPVRILNTFNAAAPGTLINSEECASIKSITSKKGITVVNLVSLGMLDAHGFLAKIFTAFARHEVIVDVVSTSEVSVSVTVDRKVSSALVEELRTFATVDEPETGMAIVCVVGEGLRTQPEVLGRLFSAVGPVPVSMVSQGASKRNVTFVVAERDARRVVAQVFHEFFESDPTL